MGVRKSFPAANAAAAFKPLDAIVKTDTPGMFVKTSALFRFQKKVAFSPGN